MDDADAADLTQRHNLDAALSRRQAALPSSGRCYNCDAVVEGARRFCDSDCRVDWERVEHARRVNGGM